MLSEGNAGLAQPVLDFLISVAFRELTSSASDAIATGVTCQIPCSYLALGTQRIRDAIALRGKTVISRMCKYGAQYAIQALTGLYGTLAASLRDVQIQCLT